MAEREPPSVVVVSQLALGAQMVVCDFVARCGAEYRCADSARIETRPNTVRFADVAVWRGERVEGPILVLEVREVNKPWLTYLERMVEYLRIGVPVVIVLDPNTTSASVFRPAHRPQIFEKDQTLTIPDVLPGFEVPVARFFEE